MRSQSSTQLALAALRHCCSAANEIETARANITSSPLLSSQVSPVSTIHFIMAPIPEPDLSSTGGTYDVNEAGIQFRHAPSLPTPKDGAEFISRLSKGLKLNVIDRPAKNELVFELIGVDVSFANALRRIMIAEVPTMALEHVYMWNNTGLIHDEGEHHHRRRSVSDTPTPQHHPTQNSSVLLEHVSTYTTLNNSAVT